MDSYNSAQSNAMMPVEHNSGKLTENNRFSCKQKRHQNRSDNFSFHQPTSTKLTLKNFISIQYTSSILDSTGKIAIGLKLSISALLICVQVAFSENLILLPSASANATSCCSIIVNVAYSISSLGYLPYRNRHNTEFIILTALT